MEDGEILPSLVLAGSCQALYNTHMSRLIGDSSMSLIELEAAVAKLPAPELDTFARWFEEFIADEWDRRIEEDIRAGRLEEAGRRADADFEAGQCKPL